ncbi:MAG: hypothetical protein ACM3IG_10050, partial [Myxococcales bacterium]
SDRDVKPVRFPALNDTDELREIGARLERIDDVGTVRQSEQVIGPRGENQVSKPRASSSRGPLTILECRSRLATCRLR